MKKDKEVVFFYETPCRLINDADGETIGDIILREMY